MFSKSDILGGSVAFSSTSASFEFNLNQSLTAHRLHIREKSTVAR